MNKQIELFAYMEQVIKEKKEAGVAREDINAKEVAIEAMRRLEAFAQKMEAHQGEIADRVYHKLRGEA